ncbi:helix-turn-helix domain-containing protein [Tsukamurella paurometabola]|uniref:Helix-turn-helix domain-containing protein n=1 Tax=Tsukamurella paurometabola TaxID=2061 RepID=A0ABS5NEW5_TSUPA|nr:helix-turn-helix domain-containing protein [Tsukamurella paurometabola]MBS4102851.1 helix-turn-helix domain-containing protein [Tsukamurella paurometabola]
MTERTPFTHAIANPATRRDIALAVADGIPVDQLADEFNIAPATARRYAEEWAGVQRTIRRLDPWERQSIVHACRRGGRRRWERELGVDVVHELLSEE